MSDVSSEQEVPEKYLTISMNHDPVFMNLFREVNAISVLRESIKERYEDGKITLEECNEYLQWILAIEHVLELDI